MTGNRIYNPTSKASDLPGTTPPKDAAFISSSEASHDFIFSSKLSFGSVDDSFSSSLLKTRDSCVFTLGRYLVDGTKATQQDGIKSTTKRINIQNIVCGDFKSIQRMTKDNIM
ncbi:hypothetical protein ACHAWX_000804 [Stephanocyclus meneghinianus]